MEQHLKRRFNGYFAIAAVILITIMAFIGLLLTRIFTNQINTSFNTLSSKQALYIAISGLEIAKRNVTQNGISCNALSTQLFNKTLANGQFSVNGSQVGAVNSLAANISASSSTIQLTNATGFSSIGIVKIDNEYIYYTSLSGNTLSGLTRGKANTTPAAHNSGARVSQNQCYITATGAIPNFTKPTAKSMVSSLIIISSGMSFDGYYPSVTSGSNVSLTGNAYIANPYSSLSSPNFDGSTVGIMGSGTISISGTAGTKVENSSGTGLVTSSSSGDINSDIAQNIPTSPSLYESYFGSETPAQLQATAIAEGHYFSSSVSNLNTLNGIQGGVIYINGNLSSSGNANITLGSPTAPVAVYISGSFSLSGSVNIALYGIIYVNGISNVTNLTGSTSITGAGSLAAAGGLNLTGTTNITLANGADNQVMSTLYSGIIPNAGTPIYITQSLGIQQIYY